MPHSQSREDDETNMFRFLCSISHCKGRNTLDGLEGGEGQPRRSAVSNKIGEFLTNKKLWNKMILISCVIAISLDPLFLYIPFIDEEKKCLGMDKKLRNVSLILRSLTDITFLVDIGDQIYEGMKKAYKKINERKERPEFYWQATLIRIDEIIPFAVVLARELKRGSLVTDLLSVFPLPQLLVVKVFFKMRGPGYFEWRMLVNFFLFGQYLSRIYRSILSYKKVTRSIGIWVKILFNLFLYILASHVLGAFWYFFSIQRETFCWHQACDNHEDRGGCMSTFYCDDHNTSTTNITFFNESCGIDVPENTKPPFNYGIFFDSLKIGNTGHIHFPTKLCYSFWWGLRNLSNVGTNLTTSNYVWENLFAILISITGSLLYLYLIGNNVQTFIHIITELSKKAALRVEEIDTWMKKNDIPHDMKKEIMKNTNMHWEEIYVWMKKKNFPNPLMKEIMKNINIHGKEDKDDNFLENLFSVLPDDMKKSLKYDLCLKFLKQEQLLRLLDDKMLKTMCDCLKPVTYAADHIIFQMKQPIKGMLLIIEGTVLTYRHTRGEETTKDSGAAPSPSPSMIARHLGKGDVYGQELLTWSSNQSGSHSRPICSENVQCRTNVEGFVLSAEDLVEVSKCKRWKLNDDP